MAGSNASTSPEKVPEYSVHPMISIQGQLQGKWDRARPSTQLEKSPSLLDDYCQRKGVSQKGEVMEAYQLRQQGRE